MSSINENVTQEINKIGLELINVNIRDITDESGYIVAIGQRAAAEAINRAKVDVLQQAGEATIGEACAIRERNVRVGAGEARWRTRGRRRPSVRSASRWRGTRRRR
ncbi:MAG: SPFH domain-containing protein [Phycisphaerales bacterium]